MGSNPIGAKFSLARGDSQISFNKGRYPGDLVYRNNRKLFAELFYALVKWVRHKICLRYFHVALRLAVPSAKGKIVKKRTLILFNFQENSTISVSQFLSVILSIVCTFLYFCPSTLYILSTF